MEPYKAMLVAGVREAMGKRVWGVTPEDAGRMVEDVLQVLSENAWAGQATAAKLVEEWGKL